MTDQAGVFPVPKVTLADGTVSAKTRKICLGRAFSLGNLEETSHPQRLGAASPCVTCIGTQPDLSTPGATFQAIKPAPV